MNDNNLPTPYDGELSRSNTNSNGSTVVKARWKSQPRNHPSQFPSSGTSQSVVLPMRSNAPHGDDNRDEHELREFLNGDRIQHTVDGAGPGRSHRLQPPGTAPPRRERRRHPVPFFLRWLGCLAVLSVVRNVWNSAVVVTDSVRPRDGHPDDARSGGDGPNPMVRSPSTPWHRSQHSGSRTLPAAPARGGETGMARTRPRLPKRPPPPPPVLPSPGGTGAANAGPLSSGVYAGMDRLFPSFLTVAQAGGDAAAACGMDGGGGGGVSSGGTRRILISGILSHPLGAELALALAGRCRVRHILGLSEHSPTVQESRRLEFLLHRVADLDVVVTEFPLGEEGADELVRNFNPTHVVHFEPNSFAQNDVEAAHQPMTAPFAARTSMNQLEQWCQAVVRLQHQTNLSDSQPSPTLLYVTTVPRPAEGTDASQELDNDMSSFSTLSMHQMHPVLLQTYHSQHHLNVSQLNLPEIYGPFEEGTGWFKDSFSVQGNSFSPPPANQTTQSQFPTTSGRASRPTSLMHISDALQSILDFAIGGNVALARKGSSKPKHYPIVAPAESRMIHLHQPSTAFDWIVSTENETLFFDKMRPILSWQHKYPTPYESLQRSKTMSDGLAESKMQAADHALKSTRYRLGESHMDPSAVSQLERRQDWLFPCNSECAQYVSCQTSTWDSVFARTKEMTRDCRYMLYMTNFSSTLEDLPLVREAANNASWPRDLFCQVAFISSKSRLVHSLLQELSDEKHSISYENPKVDWNGKLVSNGWWLVWTDQDDQSLSEADYMLPKIVPGSFVGSNTSKAFYLDTRHILPVPPLQVLWFLMARQLDARSQKAKMRQARNGETVEVPAVPPRHVALFAHTYDDDDDEDVADSEGYWSPTKKQYTGRIAQFVLEQKGMSAKDRSSPSWPTRQIQAYTEAIRWKREEGARFRPVDTCILVHHIRADPISRRLRCEWYEEQLFWSNVTDSSSRNGRSNRDLEELSLSFVLYRWRREGRLVAADAKIWGETVVERGESAASKQSEFTASTSDDQYFVTLHKRMRSRREYSRQKVV